MRLYLDENLPPELAVQLRRRGIEAITATEAGMRTTSDEEQLSFAYQENRVLITADQGIVDLAKAWFRKERFHAGILIVSGQNAQDFHAMLHMCLNVVERETQESLFWMVFPLEQYR